MVEISNGTLPALVLGVSMSWSCRAYIYYVLNHENGPFMAFAIYRHIARRLNIGFEPERYVAVLLTASLLIFSLLANNGITAIAVACLGFAWDSNKEYI